MSNSWLTFDPVYPLWAISLLTLPAFAFFIWKEFGRQHRFLVARIIALLSILVSILGILIRPAYREQKNESSFLLLTPGYSKLKVDSLLKENSSFKIIRTIEAEPYSNSEVLTSYHNLTEMGRDIKIVAGQGFPEYAFELMGSTNFKFIPTSFPMGIVDLSIPKSIVVNKRSSVKGIFNAFGKTTLKLIGPAGVEDSVTFNTSGQLPFDLFFTPKQTGLFVYTLNYPDSIGRVISERLPVEIIPAQKLKILILQKFPTAEVRYLKNYLAEKGHALALRYQTSKTNFKYEYANLNSTRIDRLTQEVTESFDLIVIDNKVLNELNVSEMRALEGGIKNGLGIIILSDDFSAKNKGVNRLLPIKLKRVVTDTVHLRFPDSKLYTFPCAPIDITPDASIQTIQKHKGHILSGYVYSDAGKVGFQLLKETYRIRLEGNEDDYAFIWSDLIERTARTKNDQFKINLVNNFPYYPDEPLTIDILSSGAQPSLYDHKTSIPLTEDVIIDDYWHGKSWASKFGWHQFITQDSTKLNYFVSNSGDWKSLRIANQLRSNHIAQASGNALINSSVNYTSREISPLIFFLMFLFGGAFLWLAPKI